MTEATYAAFALRAELHGHHEDVRAVAVGGPGLITSSRDTTIKLWAEEGATGYTCVTTLTGSGGYVGAVTWAGPDLLPGLEGGAVVSGAFDGAVTVWDLATGSAAHTCKGHAYQVTSVAVLPNGDIASASVDKTIKLWRDGRAAGELLGHEGPVQCLAVSEGGELLSGSSDTTIKRWVAQSCVQTYKGHSDTVRGLAMLPGIGFVSGSHDFSLRVWALSGECLATLAGHSAIIYSVAAAASGLIASGSEDNTLRLWSARGAALQVLQHPGCVWGVAFTPGGDLLSGCSDAVGRVWSSEPARQDAGAGAALAKQLEERKAAAAAAAGAGSGGAGAMDVDGGAPGLPPGVKVAQASELAAPGTKDGETKLVREGDGSVAAYGWSGAACVWEKIGTVVDAPEPGAIAAGRRWWGGRAWDHVFDVELDGGAKLQLALDGDENPYAVAERFLAAHELPGEFKDQIVKFIIDHTGSAHPGLRPDDMPITGGFCDPFTGGSSSAAAARGPPRPQPPAAALDSSYDVTGGGVDPFTGSSSSSRLQPAAPAAPGQVPARALLLFDAPPPVQGLRKKVVEENEALAGGAELPGEDRLSEAEVAPGGLLDALLGSLAGCVAGSGAPPSSAAIDLAARLLRWPGPVLFPGLDIVRCLVLHPGVAQSMAAGGMGTMSSPARGSLAGGLAGAAVSRSGPALQTGLRLACNCFKHAPLRAWLLVNQELLLDGFAGCFKPDCAGDTKGVRLGMATLLLNCAVAAAGSSSSGGGGGGSPEAAMQLLSGLEELLQALPGDEGEAAHRAVLALGTLLAGGGAGSELAALAGDLGLGEQLGRWASVGGKLGAAVAEVRALLAPR